MKKTNAYAYSVIDNCGKYLLVKSKESEKWNLVGGQVKNGEGRLEAFSRESMEEIGLNLKPENGIFSKDYITREGNIKIKTIYSLELPLLAKYHPGAEIQKANVFSYEKVKEMYERGKLKQGVFRAVRNHKKGKTHKLTDFC
ncbi:MAG: NUDIX domain-containing protein [Nanoarchaeota archaeon]|nr:NUDIX domain-containing protein [Nanoarchaeota archaeon]